MHKIGDVVKLNRGWTPMVCIGFTDRGHLIAKYANKDTWPIIPEDYEHPGIAHGCYTRHPSGFTAWSGKPISKEHFIMPTRYKSKTMPDVSGVLLNTTSRGDLVLEGDSGEIHVLSPSDAQKDIPYTFEAKSTNNGYRCHYTLPAGASVELGDLIISKKGNTYTVVNLDTEKMSPKTQFDGHRIVKEEL